MPDTDVTCVFKISRAWLQQQYNLVCGLPADEPIDDEIIKAFQEHMKNELVYTGELFENSVEDGADKPMTNVIKLGKAKAAARK